MTSKSNHRDYAALRRKLSLGRTIEEAAVESGMPLEEARTYLLRERSSELEHGDEKLLMWSQKALNRAYRALSNAIAEKNRQVADGTTGECGSYTKEAVLDVDAAKALLKAALDARKMIDKRREVQRRGVLPGGQLAGERDLFEDQGPWSFKNSD